jgi:hypothetical protein
MISKLLEESQGFLILQQDSVLFVVQENGETLIKQIDLPSLIKTISQSDFQSDWYLQPQPPLHHISQREGRTTTISSILPSTYLIKFASFSLGVPLPGAVIVQCQTELWVYAYKNELSLNSILYHYPLPNINNQGKVCWGNVSLPRGSSSSIWNTFMTSKFNQDYDRHKSQAYPDNIVSQLKEVAQSLNTIYPEQDLVSANLTLAALSTTTAK